MKKYYALFYYKNEAYVIRFKIKGSLRWNKEAHCFEDARWYVRSVDDVVCYAALDTHPVNLRSRESFYSFLITHDDFVAYRSEGVPRWNPQIEVIDWD